MKVGYIYHRQSAAAQDAFDAVVGRDDDFRGFLGSLLGYGATDELPRHIKATDPLLSLINSYRGGVAALNAVALECITIENEAYGDAQNAFERPPAATTLAGVREAILFAFEEDGITDLVVRGALQGALAYLNAKVLNEKLGD